jgi:uncharacterized membrane protein
MPSLRTASWVCAGLCLLGAARVAQVWAELPERMASHFGPTGAPNAWAGKAGFFVLFATISAFVVGMLLGVGWMVRVLPAGMINLPQRDYWLSPERRAQTVGHMARWGGTVAVATTAFLLFSLELVLRANLHQRGLHNGAMWTGLVAYMAFIVGMSLYLLRVFRRPQRG